MHLSEKAAQEVADLREENEKLRILVEDEGEYRSGFFKPSEIKESSEKKSETTEFDVAFIPLKDKSTNTEVIILLPTPTDSGDIGDVYFLAALAALAGKDPSAIEDRWGEYIADMQTGAIPKDINALVQAVLRESYLETNKDLQFYAEKVRYYNDLKEGIRSELTTARQYQSSLSEYAPTESEEIYPDEYGRVKLQFPWYSSEELKSLEDENESTMTEFLTLQKRYESAEADALDYANQIQENLDAKKSLRETISKLRDAILADRWPLKFSYYDENDVVTVVLSSVKDAMVLEQELEQKLQTMSDMTQMMQLDLQDAMQKQNQAMQTLSAIMKSQHDTLKAIISNMRA
jgi:hypothetical protein